LTTDFRFFTRAYQRSPQRRVWRRIGWREERGRETSRQRASGAQRRRPGIEKRIGRASGFIAESGLFHVTNQSFRLPA